MEKRKILRVDFNTTAELTQGNKKINGGINNLSLNGLFMNTDKKLDVNSLVDIKVKLSGTTTNLTVNLKGEIIRHETDGLAVKFKEMELDSFIHLRNIVFYADKELHEFYEFI